MSRGRQHHWRIERTPERVAEVKAAVGLVRLETEAGMDEIVGRVGVDPDTVPRGPDAEVDVLPVP